MGDGMTQPTKPSIVFVHGIWADGSSFGKVIPTLQAEGYEVVAAEHSLDVIQDEAIRESPGAKLRCSARAFRYIPAAPA